MKFRILFILVNFLPNFDAIAILGTSDPLQKKSTDNSVVYKNMEATNHSFYHPNRQEMIEQFVQQSDVQTQNNLKKRAYGRKIESYAQKGNNLVDKAQALVVQSPFAFQASQGGTAVSVTTAIVRAVSLGLGIYGRRQQDVVKIVTADEQILEAATKSQERIQLLTENLENLLGQKTIIDAINNLKNKDKTKTEKLLGLLNPDVYINTLNNFTDDAYITNNKLERWQSVKQTAKELEEEKKILDDYIALFQIKFLEQEMMRFHKIQYYLPYQDAEGNTMPGYKAKLEEDIQATKEGFRLLELKLNNLPALPGKNDLFGRAKASLGHDKYYARKQLIESLSGQAQEYRNHITNIQQEMQDIETFLSQPDWLQQIDQERSQILKLKEEVSLRRLEHTKDDVVGKAINDLTKENQQLKADMEILKQKLLSITQYLHKIHPLIKNKINNG